MKCMNVAEIPKVILLTLTRLHDPLYELHFEPIK